LTQRSHANVRRLRWKPWLAVAIATAVVFAALIIVVVSPSGSAAPVSRTSASPPAERPVAAVDAVSPSVAHALTLSGSSAGKVVRTLFVNYNGSAPGNFPSLVWQWDAGGGATVDPLTGQLWIPEFPIQFPDVPTPPSAPALAYNATTNATQMVPALANTTAIAFDPINGLLYATRAPDGAPGSVVSYDPATNVVGPPVLVGYDPRAISYDPGSQNLFVANSASGNVTVLNGTTGLKQATISSGGIDPIALADDTTNGKLFVANGGAYLGTYNVSVINPSSDTLTGSRILLAEPASSLAWSANRNLLAIAIPTSAFLEVYDASSLAIAGPSAVGYNVSSVVSNENGTEFVATNGTEPHLSIVPATGAVFTPATLPVLDIPARLTVDPTNGLLYSWSNANRTVTTVNLSVGTQNQLSPDLGVQGGTIAYDPDSGNVFIADWSSHSISVVNASTFSTVRSPIAVPGIPTSLVDDALTGTIYVGYTGGVMALDAATGSVVASSSVPDLAGNNTQLVVDAKSSLLWDLNRISGLYALDMPSLTLQLATHIGEGTINIRGVTLDSETNVLFVVNRSNPAEPSLVEVNGTDGQHEVLPINIQGLLSVAYDPADQEVYALGQSVWIINPNNGTIEAGPIPITPHVVAWTIVYDPSREYLYVTSNASLGLAWPGNVTVIDGSSVAASEGSYVSIAVGQLPIDSQPIQLRGSLTAGSSEIWVTNFLSGTISIIASPPQITFFAATPNPVDAGVQSTLLLGLTGGAGPTLLSYAGLPSGCTSANTPSLNCTTAAAGTYNVTVTGVDSLAFTTNATTVLSVSPALKVTIALGSGNPSEIDLGQVLSASATLSGGTGPFGYAWSFGDGIAGSGPSVSHTYAAIGVYLISVTATDAGGGFSSATSTLTVVALPAVTVVTTPSNITDVNIPIAFFASVAGGTTPGTASWTFEDGSTGTGTSVSHAYTAPGVYFATVHYVDASGVNATNFATITVNPTLAATFTVATGPTSDAIPSGSTVTTGTSLQFTTSVTGGTAPLTIVWGFGDGSYGYGVQSTHTYGTAGTYTVTLFIEDGVGAEWNATYHIVVSSSSTSSTFGTNFDEGLLLGLLIGVAAATVILFAAARRKSRPPPSPPSAYVPPEPTPEAPAEQPWQES
jgi:DNA-binding beta-propeller fold protein YncE